MANGLDLVSPSLLQMAETMIPTGIIPVVVRTEPVKFQSVLTKIATLGLDGATKRLSSAFNNIQDFFPPLNLPSLSSFLPGLSALGLPPPPVFPPNPFARINIPDFSIFNLALVNKDLDSLHSIEGVDRIFHDSPMLASEATPELIDKRGWILPEKIYQQYGLEEADKDGHTGAGVTVAVLDTGCAPTASLPFVESYGSPPFPPAVDENGHGTWCAHWIAGQPVQVPNLGLLRGMSPQVKLITVKVLGFGIGTGTTSGILMGMDIALNRGARVISMSLGGAGQKDAENPYTEVINRTKDKVLWVIAAGNDGLKGPSTIGTPGSVADAITVGSLSFLDRERSYFSSQGPSPDGYQKPDVFGFGGGRAWRPDKNVPGREYDEYLLEFTSFMSLLDGAIDLVPDGVTPLSGTSMATPGVAAVLARAVQKWPDLTTDDVKKQLQSSSGPYPLDWSMFRDRR